MSLIDSIKNKTSSIRGVFENASDLPANAKEGDYGVVISTKTFWIYSNGSWSDSGGTGGGAGSVSFSNISGVATSNASLKFALDGKTNLVSGAIANHLLITDASGQPKDSGYPISETLDATTDNIPTSKAIDKGVTTDVVTIKSSEGTTVKAAPLYFNGQDESQAFISYVSNTGGSIGKVYFGKKQTGTQNIDGIVLDFSQKKALLFADYIATTRNLALRYDNKNFPYYKNQILVDQATNDRTIVLEDFTSSTSTTFQNLINTGKIATIPLGSRMPYPTLDNPDQNPLYNNENGFSVDSKIEYNGQVWVYISENAEGIPSWVIKEDVVNVSRSFNLVDEYANGTIIIVSNAIGMPNADYSANPISANLFTKSFKANYIINDSQPVFDILDSNGNLVNQLPLEYLSSSENPIKNDDDLLLSNNNLGCTNQGDLNDALTSQITKKLENTVATFVEQSSTPSIPNAGELSFYAKTDDKLYYLNSAGAEVEVGAGSATVSSGELEPIGTVKAYYGKTAPQGYLICDGSSYSKDVYTSLWAFATSESLTTTNATNKGLFFDNGDRIFKVPDLRGYFLRGLGGVDPDIRTLGSVQGDDFKSHGHTGLISSTNSSWYSGIGFQRGGSDTFSFIRTGPSNANSITVNDVRTGSAGGAETRPVNIAVNYIIKAQVIGGASIVGGLTYKGSWDASTNTPTLPNVNDQNGYYYKVSVKGNTNINGITSWDVGDWIVFNGTNYDQIANYEAVNSVNGKLGNVTITATDVGLGNVTNVDTANASNITSGTLADTQLSGKVTLQGNSFNGANELVKLDSDSKLPTSDASNLYNLPNEIFSTVETSTGVKFVDGKTIYRKVVPFVNIYGTIVLDSTLKTTYVDNLIACYGGFNGVNYTIGISNAAGDKSNAVSLSLDVNGLTAIVSAFAGRTNKGYIIAEYTKL
jgi:hypothetical protein